MYISLQVNISERDGCALVARFVVKLDGGRGTKQFWPTQVCGLCSPSTVPSHYILKREIEETSASHYRQMLDDDGETIPAKQVCLVCTAIRVHL